MNFLILGDKFQKRMKSKGCVALIKTHNKNIIQSQYNIIKKVFPKAKIIYVYGFDSKRFITFLDKQKDLSDIITINNPCYEDKNYGYSLFLLQQYLNDDCFIMFGDNIISKCIFNKFDISKGSQVFISKDKNKLGCIINQNKIENISYDLDNYLSQIYYISKNDARVLQNLIKNPKYHNYFIFEIMNKMIDLNRNILPLMI